MGEGWGRNCDAAFEARGRRERDARSLGDGIAARAAPEVALRVGLSEPREAGGLVRLLLALGEVAAERIDEARVRGLDHRLAGGRLAELADDLLGLLAGGFEGFHVYADREHIQAKRLAWIVV